ncbi:hypothetical protein ACWEKM_43425 [Streptomyces sp. NPDC004752]
MKLTSMRMARDAAPAVAPGALTASGTSTNGCRALVDVQASSHTFYRDH